MISRESPSTWSNWSHASIDHVADGAEIVPLLIEAQLVAGMSWSAKISRPLPTISLNSKVSPHLARMSSISRQISFSRSPVNFHCPPPISRSVACRSVASRLRCRTRPINPGFTSPCRAWTGLPLRFTRLHARP